MRTPGSEQPIRWTDAINCAGWLPTTGILVADASLRPLFSNREAIAILTFPGPQPEDFVSAVRKTFRSTFLRAQDSALNRKQPYPVIRVKSGRRTYFCRACRLDSNGNGYDSKGTAVLITLERGKSSLPSLSEIAKQFHLTHREQEVVRLLLQGLSNKEMAEQMGISANTVKAFLHMVTLKMCVSSRSGIVTRILTLVLSSGNGSEFTEGRQ